MRAIVVDDNPANLYYVAKLLQNDGFETITASGYFEALNALSDSVGLLLADIRLGQANGLQLARMSLARQPALNVLLMTAYRDQELAAVATGFPVIRLPVMRRTLLTEVRRVTKF